MKYFGLWPSESPPRIEVDDVERSMDQNELTTSEAQALREVARGRMMQRKIGDADRDRLLELGYIERKFGGLQATTEGHQYVVAHRT
jgi:hypothetical protein